MELGNHAEFLGSMTRAEMLAMFFVHDGARTSQWRLKGHAKRDFWRWVASWAVALKHPRDLGSSAGGYDLPPLEVHEHITASAYQNEGLFNVAASLSEQRAARRENLDVRVQATAAIINAEPTEAWVAWCELNDESAALTAAIPGAIELSGSDDLDAKEAKLEAFTTGDARVLVTKPSIAAHGLNWQHCARTAFCGVGHSFEQYYQAVRRFHRYGQTRPVHVHLVYAESDVGIRENLLAQRTRGGGDERAHGHAHDATHDEHQTQGGHRVPPAGRDGDPAMAHVLNQQLGDNHALYWGDAVDVVAGLPDDTVDYSVFSPPFASLYTYSDDPRDMGNSRDYSEFEGHFRYLVTDLHRVMKPGRLVSVHCMNLPTSKARDGVIGIRDFRGDIIRWFETAGFIYHSEVVIWKDPVTAMQRTKALGLLYKQLRKDSAMSRQGIPDYLVTFRKLGENPDPVTKTHDSFPVDRWQRYASPVWMDIDAGRTLQYTSARDNEDERHICPLQLDVIERAIELWTNPGDTVLSPFAGIGSEGWTAVRMGRRFVGAELKESYYRVAADNLRQAEMDAKQVSMFAEAS